METFTLAGSAYPSELQEITLALWTDLRDAGGLRERLIKAPSMDDAERRALDFAFLDARMASPRFDILCATSFKLIYSSQCTEPTLTEVFPSSMQILSRDQVLTAAHQAILSAAQGELRTQTVHSETIDHLNPTSNVSFARGLIVRKGGPPVSPDLWEADIEYIAVRYQIRLKSDDIHPSAHLPAFRLARASGGLASAPNPLRRCSFASATR